MTNPEANACLPDLPRGYTREPAVAAEILSLPRAGDHKLWRALDATGSPKPETLVFLLRELRRHGNIDGAWRIAETLAGRVAGAVNGFLSRQYGISRDQGVEIYDDVLTSLYSDWMSTEPECAFWEVRFGVCLKRKLFDAVKRHRRVSEPEVSGVVLDADGEPRDLVEEAADERAMSPEIAALAMDALSILPPAERVAFFLRIRDGWTESEIAKHLSVTDRTVRNYLRRAEKRLAAWRGAEGNNP